MQSYKTLLPYIRASKRIALTTVAVTMKKMNAALMSIMPGWVASLLMAVTAMKLISPLL